MNLNELKDFCTYFYGSSSIPIRVYHAQTMQLQLPIFDITFDPFTPYCSNLINQPQSVTYLITNQFIYYGLVKNLSEPDSCVIIGPLTNTKSANDNIKEVLKDASIPLSHLSSFMEIFQNIPIISFDRFLLTLCFIHYSLNNQKISMYDILDFKSNKLLLSITEEHTSNVYTAKEEQAVHNSYQFEKQYLRFIENGDLNALKELFDKPVIITPGIVANNSLRQLKNIFIACATLETRAAIKGGLEMENAYQLSDIYIQKVENLQTIESIYALQYQMLFDFAERVAASKIPEGISPLVYECIQYVSLNTNQPISVSEVASHVKKSRSFVSRTFKLELGFALGDFITRKKIEEAKSLLSFSDKTISEISSYLYFSSQSYFQNVFKKKVGMTPNEYRAKTMSKKNTL